MPDRNAIEDAITEIKRTALSRYCLNQCQKSCCLFDGLSISVDAPQLSFLYDAQLKSELLYKAAGIIGCQQKAIACLFQKTIRSLREKGILKNEGKRYRLQNAACPRYDEKTGACLVHDDPRRPDACGPFPITFNDGTGVVLDARCPYVYRNWEEIISSLSGSNGKKAAAFKVIAPFIMGVFPYDAKDYRKMREHSC